MTVNAEWQRIKDHIRQYREDPDAAHAWNPYGKVVTALLLTATGRRSGRQRSLPLIYRKVGADYVIVGSKGGAPDDPVWYKNLQANPDCEIQVGREHLTVRARTAQGAEREALWQQMVELLPQYAEYQARTPRAIPVVVLEPRP
ncbi:MAG: nitroreductase family deazaflavin-dependent oxidoreductase [Gammaproteobacteria bacterium]